VLKSNANLPFSFYPPYATIPLPLGPSGGLLNGLYAARDFSLKGGGKGFLGSLRLRFKRLYPLKWAITQ